jgi:mannan endo-1,4-beta-mannosidase
MQLVGHPTPEQQRAQRKRRTLATLLVASLAGFGMIMLAHSFAATFAKAAEAEQGITTPVATSVNETGASGGAAVRFGTAGGGGLPDTGPLGKRIKFGIFTPDTGQGLQAAVSNLEGRLGHKLATVQYFTDLSSSFDLTQCQQLAAGGHDLLMAIEPDGATSTILSGGKDSIIKKLAADIAKCPTQTYIRLYPEMNGSWATYSPYHDRDYPGDSESAHTTNVAQLVSSYKHIIDIFRTVNPNVKWMFCPNQTDDPADANNTMEGYYPGAAYTDITAFDAYNWGDGGPFGAWQSAHDVYSEPYGRLTALNATAPVWVTETSSKEPQEDDGYGLNPGKSKGQWITDLFNDTAYPHLKAIIWFNIDKHTNNPGTDSERDWRLDSSTDSFNAAKQALTQTP